jgi:ADP-dependent NAD(P)H-hydrate dehydratase / NAD(P)H-hydrate epimerase
MSLPIISAQQMREWERATWATGQTESAVIARVGEIIAQRALQLTKAGETILILAGKGHNGDDARAAIPHLHDRKVILLDVLDPQIALGKFRAACENNPTPKLILDGLFGIGLSRSLDDNWQKLIIAVNESEIPVLAIDTPSGIDADTGEIRGAAIEAAITLTLAAPKRGLLSPSATSFVGRLEVAPEIGLVPCPFSSHMNWTCAEDFKSFPPARKVSSHKGSYGHVAIVAGSLGYHGAAVLAAHGALRAQPGLVSVFTPENVYLPVASQLQAAMVHPWKLAKQFPESCSAILFGPGLASPELPNNLKFELIQIWQESPLPVIVDASALDWLPTGGDFQKQIRVITPHPGEAARMLSISTEAVQADRVSALRKLSARHGNCFVVLKGHQTVVGRSEGEIFINSSGNPFLAQGGSGDVLAGYISGLLAQPALQTEPLKTIRYAVWQHGAAADRLGDETNWIVEDLVKSLGEKKFKQH